MAVAMPTLADADESSYSCSKGVVSVGDTVYTIIKKCGEPTGKENLAGGGAEATEEHW